MCLPEVVNYIACLLAWHLKGGELVSKPPAEYFLSPSFFYQSLKLIRIFWHEPDKSPVPTAKGLDPKYNDYILPRPLGSGDRGFIDLRHY